MLIWLLFSCVDYSFFPGKDKPLPEDAQTAPTGADGYVIGDGVCCSLDWDLSVPLIQDEVCFQEQNLGVLDIEIEWERSNFDDYVEWGQTVMAPMIGQLTDDNGDGVISNQDDPDIVLITDDAGYYEDRHGVIRILRGADGGMIDAIEIAQFENYTIHPYRYSNVALGDVDSDGAPEIVFVAEVIADMIDQGEDSAVVLPEPTSEDTSAAPTAEPADNPIVPTPPNGPNGQNPSHVSCRVVAMNPNMEIEWVAEESLEGCGGHAPFLTDLTGDGTVEVLLGAMLLNGADGSLLGQGQGDKGRYEAYVEIGLHSIAVDLDGDNIQEVLAGRTIYDPNMLQICQNDALYDGFTATADFDLDGKGEVLLVGAGQVTIFEKDCSTINRWQLPGFGTGGPPTVADYDGDSIPEIGIVDGEYYSVFESDGTVLWSQPVQDVSSHATGSIVFDFEDDAYPEVVYADETTLWVLDGMTGQPRLEFTEHSSRTLHEYPTIADLDRDGSAEIVVVNGGGHDGNVATGITVLGSATSSWPSARQVWNQHAYFITNVNDDLTIPSNPQSNWSLYNNFRSGGISQQIGADLPDGLLDMDVCFEECDEGRIVVGIQVGNQGLAPLLSNTNLLIYTDNDTLLETVALGVNVNPMNLSNPINISLNRDDVQNGILRAEISTLDCGDGNDVVELLDVTCE